MKILKKLNSDKVSLHIMVLIPAVVAFIFYYIPMGGIILSFQNYKPGLGVAGSEWVGLDNFRYLFAMDEFTGALRNTLFIAIFKITLNLIVPIIFALMLNELRANFSSVPCRH